jgi:hypothetical protein
MWATSDEMESLVQHTYFIYDKLALQKSYDMLVPGMDLEGVCMELLSGVFHQRRIIEVLKHTRSNDKLDFMLSILAGAKRSEYPHKVARLRNTEEPSEHQKELDRRRPSEEDDEEEEGRCPTRNKPTDHYRKQESPAPDAEGGRDSAVSLPKKKQVFLPRWPGCVYKRSIEEDALLLQGMSPGYSTTCELPQTLLTTPNPSQGYTEIDDRPVRRPRKSSLRRGGSTRKSDIQEDRIDKIREAYSEWQSVANLEERVTDRSSFPKIASVQEKLGVEETEEVVSHQEENALEDRFRHHQVSHSHSQIFHSPESKGHKVFQNSTFNKPRLDKSKKTW